MTQKRRVILSAYQDCAQVFETAIARGGVRLEFESRKDATVFRHRCYRYRGELAKQSETKQTAFDRIFIQRESDTVPGGSEATLLFKLRPTKPAVEMKDLDGNPIEIEELPADADFDDLAEALTKSLKL